MVSVAWRNVEGCTLHIACAQAWEGYDDANARAIHERLIEQSTLDRTCALGPVSAACDIGGSDSRHFLIDGCRWSVREAGEAHAAHERDSCNFSLAAQRDKQQRKAQYAVATPAGRSLRTSRAFARSPLRVWCGMRRSPARQRRTGCLSVPLEGTATRCSCRSHSANPSATACRRRPGESSGRFRSRPSLSLRKPRRTRAQPTRSRTHARTPAHPHPHSHTPHPTRAHAHSPPRQPARSHFPESTRTCAHARTSR